MFVGLETLANSVTTYIHTHKIVYGCQGFIWGQEFLPSSMTYSSGHKRFMFCIRVAIVERYITCFLRTYESHNANRLNTDITQLWVYPYAELVCRICVTVRLRQKSLHIMELSGRKSNHNCRLLRRGKCVSMH